MILPMAFPESFQKWRTYCLRILIVLVLAALFCPAYAVIINPDINPEDLLGTLSVTTTPADAEVWINGDFAGRTPLSKGLAIGTYTLKITSTGYKDVTQQVEITSRATTTVSLKLVAVIPTGNIVIDSTPKGATIFVNSIEKGKTPISVQNVRTGTYTITLKLDGYAESTDTVTVTEGKTTTYSPVLEPVAATGSISVKSTPSGATIYLDGREEGETPFVITGVSPGSHTIRLTRTGYDDYSVPVSVVSGKTAQLTILLTSSDDEEDLEPSTTGSIAVSSVPSGASVFLDGEKKGTSPVTLKGVTGGAHTVKLTLTGYSDYNGALAVVAGETIPLKAELIKSIPNSTKGAVSITSNPPGARVSLNDLYRGTTPLTLTSLEPGDYQILLTLTGYNALPGTITVTAGESTSFLLTLIPLENNNDPDAEEMGTLIIQSTPSGANVYLNGDLKGTTPLTIEDVKTGTSKLLFTKSGYEDTVKVVDVKSGATETVEVTMEGGKSVPGFTAFFCILSFISIILIWRRSR